MVRGGLRTDGKEGWTRALYSPDPSVRSGDTRCPGVACTASGRQVFDQVCAWGRHMSINEIERFRSSRDRYQRLGGEVWRSTIDYPLFTLRLRRFPRHGGSIRPESSRAVLPARGT